MRNFRKALALLLVFTALICLTACGEDTSIDILDEVPNLGESKDDSNVVSEEDPLPAEGQTAMPVAVQVFNSTQTTVAILGTCEEGATVTASIVGGNKTTVNANGKIFALEIDVGTRSEAHIQLTATAPDKTESEPKVVVGDYNAIAEGNLVYPTVLADKVTLFLQSSLDVLSEDVVRTNTAIDTFTSKIDMYVNSLNNIGETELIYVLMPSRASGMTDSLPEGTDVTDGVTLYDQAVAAIKASGATLIDVKAALADKELEDIPLYYRTHSTWSEYGAYLAYCELMNYIAEKYPAAAPRGLDEFEVKKVEDALGGNLAYHFGFDCDLVRETVYDLVPKFNLDLGDSVPENVEVAKTYLISDIKQYLGENDYKFYDEYFAGKQIYNDPAYTAVDSSFGFYTGRNDLPTALIYRDDATYGAVDMLAERFNNCLFEEAGKYTVNASKAASYAADGKNNVDYVIVMISEDNLTSLIANND